MKIRWILVPAVTGLLALNTAVADQPANPDQLGDRIDSTLDQRGDAIREPAGSARRPGRPAAGSCGKTCAGKRQSTCGATARSARAIGSNRRLDRSGQPCAAQTRPAGRSCPSPAGSPWQQALNVCPVGIESCTRAMQAGMQRREVPAMRRVTGQSKSTGSFSGRCGNTRVPDCTVWTR